MAVELAAPALGTRKSSPRPLVGFSMIVKTPALMRATKTLHLSVLDQNCPRVYTAAHLVFPFPDANLAEAAIQAISAGLAETLCKFPFLTGMLYLADASGRLGLKYTNTKPDVKDFAFTTKTISLSDDFPYTYQQLKKLSMPPSAFEGKMLLPQDLLNYEGVPVSGEGLVDFEKSEAPAMRMQANFIPGGLVLTSLVHHTMMDCSGIEQFWTHLSKSISVSQDKTMDRSPEASSMAPSLDQSCMREALDARAPALAPGHEARAESYVDGTYTYTKTLPGDAPCTLRYFVISASRIRLYRDRLRPYFPDSSPPTICNVLAALLWIYSTRARARRLGKGCWDRETSVGIATDLRKRMDPPMDPSYTGNCALFSRGTLKIADIVSETQVTEETIVRVVREIRRAIHSVGNDWVHEHLAFFKSIKQITDTECALGFRFGLDMYITSWMNFSADLSWGIPGTDLDPKSLDGRAEYIRRSYAPTDGGMMIMPRRRRRVGSDEAPYEVVVRLADVDMQHLLDEDGGLSSWAERITS